MINTKSRRFLIKLEFPPMQGFGSPRAVKSELSLLTALSFGDPYPHRTHPREGTESVKQKKAKREPRSSLFSLIWARIWVRTPARCLAAEQDDKSLMFLLGSSVDFSVAREHKALGCLTILLYETLLRSYTYKYNMELHRHVTLL